MRNAINYILLLLLAAMWGPSFLFLKIVVREIPPITVACIRSIVGAFILFTLVKFLKHRFPKDRSVYFHFIWIGFFATAFPFTLITWGELYIESAMAAILNGTVPLFTIILAHFASKDDKITFPKLLGLIIGFGGLLILLYPSINLNAENNLLGILAVVLASMSYAIGLIYAKSKMKGQDQFVAPTLQLSASAFMLIPFSIFVDKPWEFLGQISMDVFLSIAFLCVFGSALAYILYYKILEKAGPAFLSSVTYIMPVFGVVLGAIFLNEKLSVISYFGAALIIIGIAISGGVFRNAMQRFAFQK